MSTARLLYNDFDADIGIWALKKLQHGRKEDLLTRINPRGKCKLGYIVAKKKIRNSCCYGKESRESTVDEGLPVPVRNLLSLSFFDKKML